MSSKSISLFDREILSEGRRFLQETQSAAAIQNPVMFVTLLGAILTFEQLFVSKERFGFVLQVALWLLFTVVFANFAEAMAEGRGKAQARALRFPAANWSPSAVVFDGVVGQYLGGQRAQLSVGQLGEPVFLQGANGVGVQAEIGQRLARAGHRIHHARLGENMNQLRQTRRRGEGAPITQRRDDRTFDDGIDQEPQRGLARSHRGQTRPGSDIRGHKPALDRGDAQLRGLGGNAMRGTIGLAGQRINVNFPQHRAPFSLQPKVSPDRRHGAS